MSTCMELVQHRVLHYLRISFMVPGHTKFAPDLFFSQIAKPYYKSDETDLQLVVEQFSFVMIDNGGIVRRKWVKNIPTYQELETCMIF